MDKEKKDELLLLCDLTTNMLLKDHIKVTVSVTIEGYKISADVLDIAFNKYLYIKYKNAKYYISKEPYKSVEGVFDLNFDDGKIYHLHDVYSGAIKEGCFDFTHMDFHEVYETGDPDIDIEWYPIYDGYSLSIIYHDMSDYYDYMQSNEWDKKRRDTYRRAGDKCQECGKTGVILNAHHKVYTNFKNEKEEDLIALCNECHSKYHK